MAHVISSLGVDTLSLRGAGAEFNSFSRFFKSQAEALAEVASGGYIPTPGKTNAVLMLGAGIMVYDFTLLDFVHITQMAGAGNQADKFIELDGANDYLQFPTRAGGSEDALDWSKSWSIGITLLGLQASSDSLYCSLFSSGTNHILLRRGGSNWGMYVTANDNSYGHGANTWYAPTDFDRILFTYDHLTSRLKYYLGDPVAGTFAMRANLLVNATVLGANNPDANLYVGRGASAIINWDGGVNNMIVSDQVLTGPQVTEFFQTGEDFTTHEYYSDLTSYCRLGEDTFPAIVDDKGNMTASVMVNGASDDFADVPVVPE